MLVDGLKVAGILVEGRPQEDWAVLGIGLNVAVSVTELPPELRDSAGTLGLEPTSIEPVLAELLEQLERLARGAGRGDPGGAEEARRATRA